MTEQRGSYDIDIVVVGKNNATTLQACLERAASIPYSRGKLHLYYVDRASHDASLKVANQIEEIHLVEWETSGRNLGCALNAGWRAGSSPFVLFLDATCLLEPMWLECAIDTMARDVGYITGVVQPERSESSIFNWIYALEWRHIPPTQGMAVNRVVRRTLLEEIGGFSESLRYGTIRDFCDKTSKTEWKNLHLPQLMCKTNLGKLGLSDWWRDGVHDGYAQAALKEEKGGKGALFTSSDLRPTLLRGGLSYLLLLITLLGWLGGSFWVTFLLFPMAILLLYPRIFQVNTFEERYGLSPIDAAAYGWHASLIAAPRFWGWLCVVARHFAPKGS